MTNINDNDRDKKLDKLADEIERESMENYRSLMDGTDRNIIHQACMDIFGDYSSDHKEFSQICITTCLESQQEVIIQARNIIKTLILDRNKVTEDHYEEARKFIVNTRIVKSHSNNFERMSKSTLIIMRRLNQFSTESRGKMIKSIATFYDIK